MHQGRGRCERSDAAVDRQHWRESPGATRGGDERPDRSSPYLKQLDRGPGAPRLLVAPKVCSKELAWCGELHCSAHA